MHVTLPLKETIYFYGGRKIPKTYVYLKTIYKYCSWNKEGRTGEGMITWRGHYYKIEVLDCRKTKGWQEGGS